VNELSPNAARAQEFANRVGKWVYRQMERILITAGEAEKQETSGPAPSSASSALSHDPPSQAASHGRFSIHVAWTLATRLSMAVVTLLTGVIITRWLGAAGYGAFAVLNVAVAIAVQIGNAGLPSASLYFISQDRRNLPSVAVISLSFALVVGSLLALGMIVLAARGSAPFSAIPLSVSVAAAISIPFQLLTLLGLNLFLGLGQIRRFNMLDAAGQLSAMLNAVISLIMIGAGLFALVSLNTVASFLVSLVIAWLIGREILRKESEFAVGRAARLFGRMAGYSLKFHISIVLGLLIIRADLLIVEYFRGAAEAGVYAVASQAASLLLLLPGVIGTLLFPRVASARDMRGDITCAVTRHTAFIMLIISLAAVPASFMLPVLFGAPFADATIQFLLLLPGIYLLSIESVLVQHFTGTGFPAAIPLFWVAVFIVNIALNLSLVPLFGARGAALASLVCYTMIFVLVAIYFRARTGNSLSAALLLRAPELRRLWEMARFSSFPGGVNML